MRELEMLTRYKEWADRLFLARVSELEPGQLIAPQSIVFGSLIRTLHHLYLMDHVWQCHLLGRPHALTTRNPAEHPDLAALVQRQEAIDSWYVDHASGLSDQQEGEEVEFTFIGGGAGRMSRREIILHVVNHTTYHRGHAADMLYRFGVAPPTTDLPVFLAGSRQGSAPTAGRGRNGGGML